MGDLIKASLERRDLIYIHVSIELRERFVKVVHLREDADNNHNAEHVGARMAKLVVPRESKLDGDAKGFDSHDRYRTDGGADRQVY